jgi:hypothetical protein
MGFLRSELVRMSELSSVDEFFADGPGVSAIAGSVVAGELSLAWQVAGGYGPVVVRQDFSRTFTAITGTKARPQITISAACVLFTPESKR